MLANPNVPADIVVWMQTRWAIYYLAPHGPPPSRSVQNLGGFPGHGWKSRTWVDFQERRICSFIVNMQFDLQDVSENRY